MEVPPGLKRDPELERWLEGRLRRRTARWRQADALLAELMVTIGELDAALAACPEQRWESPLWEVSPTDAFMTPRPDGTGGDRSPEAMQMFAAFWYVAYHAIFFLDLDLWQVDSRPYRAPRPFGGEREHGVDEDQVAVLPDRVYTRQELRGYLKVAAERAQRTLARITEEQARGVCRAGSARAGRQLGEVLVAQRDHLAEHAAQLQEFLAQT
jgi:hypothetical protein